MVLSDQFERDPAGTVTFTNFASRKHRHEPDFEVAVLSFGIFYANIPTKMVPQTPNCFMADFDAEVVQQIFHIATGQRKTDLNHRYNPDDLSARFAMTT